MNIFLTDPDYMECAANLDDKRVVKMCLETAQIVSTALYLNGVDSDELYKPTHRNHPVVLWAADNTENMRWTLCHGFALCSVYTSAFNKEHASQKVLMNSLYHLGYVPRAQEITPQPNCAANAKLGLDFKHLPTIKAYREYLNARWHTDKKPPVWTNRRIPVWADDATLAIAEERLTHSKREVCQEGRNVA